MGMRRINFPCPSLVSRPVCTTASIGTHEAIADTIVSRHCGAASIANKTKPQGRMGDCGMRRNDGSVVVDVCFYNIR